MENTRAILKIDQGAWRRGTLFRTHRSRLANAALWKIPMLRGLWGPNHRAPLFRTGIYERYLASLPGLLVDGYRRAIWVEADLRIRLIWKSLKQVFDRWVSTANGL
jgi:hypothetical protein